MPYMRMAYILKRMQRKHTYHLLAYISIVLTLFLFFLRMVYPVNQIIITPDFGQSDAITSLATKFTYSSSLHQHLIPFWSAKIGGGYPIYANGGLGVWYIPNLIFFSTMPTSLAFICSLFFSLLLLGLGMYVWLQLLGRSIVSSLFGALTAALCGYVIVQFTHLTIVQSIGIFPWCLVLTHLLITNPKHKYIPLLAGVYAQLICIGFAQSIFITSIFMLVYTLWLSMRLKVIIRSVIYIAISVFLGILLSAIHLLPALEFLRQLNNNGIFTPDTATLFSYPWSHLITLVYPFALGNPATGTYPHFFAFNGSIFWENTAYIGILPLILCCYAGISGILRRGFFIRTRIESVYLSFFTYCAIGAFFLMLGRNSPFYFIYTFYPFTLFRIPSRFIWVFIISLIMVSSFALDGILEKIRNKRTQTLVGIFIIVLQIFTQFYMFSAYHNLEPAAEWLKTPSLTQYLLPGYTISIGGETAYNSVYSKTGWVTQTTQNHPSYILRNTFTPDKNLLWDVSQIKDYSGREFKRTKIMNDLLSQSFTTNNGYATVSAIGEKIFSLYGISNVISTLKLTHTSLQQKAVLSDPNVEITLLHNPQSLPKAYIATEIRQVHTVKEAVAALSSDTFTLGKTAIIEKRVSASVSGTPATLRIRSMSDGVYEYELTPVDHASVIVTTENYYPGWRVTIDGNSYKPFPVNVSQIGILAPPYAKHIVLRFEPTDFKRGAIISICTLIILGIAGVYLLFFGKTRRE